MTLRFAAARSAAHSPIARALTRRTIVGAANDTHHKTHANFTNDEVLEAALRHFAVHGLDAGAAAARKAKQALNDGDTKQYVWWLEICRNFDRGHARRLERTMPVASNF